MRPAFLYPLRWREPKYLQKLDQRQFRSARKAILTEASRNVGSMNDANPVLHERTIMKAALVMFMFATVSLASMRPTATPAEKALVHLDTAAEQYGLSSPRAELRVLREHRGSTDITHVRFQQIHRGVPVHLGTLIAHTPQSGKIRVTRGLFKIGEVDVVPSISAERARDITLTAVRPTGPFDNPDVKLKVYSKATPGAPAMDRDALVWHVTLELLNDVDSPAMWEYFISAHTGEIIAVSNSITNATTYWYRPANRYRPMYRAMIEGNNATPVSNPYWAFWKQVGDPSTKNRGVLQSPCDGLEGTHPPCEIIYPPNTAKQASGLYGNWVGDAKNKTTATGVPLEQVWALEGCACVVWGDGQRVSNNVFTKAADAFLGLWDTFDFLKNRLGRSGINDGDRQTYALVRYNWINNATFSPSRHAILLGPGDGSTTSDMVSLDVVAHEVGHLLNEYIADLGITGETGGLNESNSDIFATLVEHWKHSHGGFGISGYAPNYWIGEQTRLANWLTGNVFDPQQAIRFMDDPGRDGVSPACWSSTLNTLTSHRQAGPSNHMFYLLAEGGVSKCNGNAVDSVGREPATNIWYNAMFYMTPTTNYAGARAAYVSAATDLYGAGSPQVNSVNAAFDAIAVP